jgi:hypothetical protein
MEFKVPEKSKESNTPLFHRNTPTGDEWESLPMPHGIALERSCRFSEGSR